MSDRAIDDNPTSQIEVARGSMPSQTTSNASVPLDRRRHVFRPDLADEALRGRVEATSFVVGQPCQVLRSAVSMRAEPNLSAALENEALFGEIFTVFEDQDGWAWGKLSRDQYTGYVPIDALSPNVLPATHRVSDIGTFVYADQDIKSPPLLLLSLNASLAVVEVGERFSRLSLGGYVITRHISPIGKPALDFVEIAERFIATPYLWGGRTRLGLDCSALVQLAMEAGGLECPRDSDMQRAEVGHSIPVPDDLEGLHRGDLVFWKGHVGIMTDGVMLLHANAHHMAVACEPLQFATARILKASGGPIAAIKRLGSYKNGHHVVS
jgi:cell wall-associated NlpC family hydrolase